MPHTSVLAHAHRSGILLRENQHSLNPNAAYVGIIRPVGTVEVCVLPLVHTD